ncbi:MAG: TIM barrel protein [Parasporobacterium sp.]|nr:TIM barrel protein [Parasporobacterium sp.]
MRAFKAGFDGVELMFVENNEQDIITPAEVTGVHAVFPEYWLDFWRGDMKACLKELDTTENVLKMYGGSDRMLLVYKLRSQFEKARQWNAEYMVLHAMHCTPEETWTLKFSKTDEEIVEALCEIINKAIPYDADGPVLLLENLWESGFTFTRPEITKKLMEGISYPRKGIMLDTGHLAHTNLDLRNPKEALQHINAQLDKHGDLCSYIKGIHLNMSVTGAYMKSVMENPPAPLPTYEERMGQLFEYVFRVDGHRPFVCHGISDLIDRISPDYLTYEIISNNLPDFMAMLDAQRSIINAGI